MNDLISRQAAIDLFPNDALEWDTNCGYIAPHFARRMIEELPSAQPEIIRCKERRMRLIDADDLKDWSEIVQLTDDGGIDINDFEEKLKSMPTIDAIPIDWIKETRSRAEEIGDTKYADFLDVIISHWRAVEKTWRKENGLPV